MKYLLSLIGFCAFVTNIDREIPDVRPPGTVKIEENFYADEGELTNIDYKEYLNYIERIWGKTSDTYNAALPDTTVWSEDMADNEPLVNTYFRHPAFNDYPVVGISYNQALQYSAWRSDRVTEMMLLQDGLIKPIENLSEKNYFSIDRYQTGDYDWIISHEDIMMAKYTLPTEAEWEFIAKGNVQNEYGLDSLNRKVRKALKKNSCLFNTIKSQSERSHGTFTIPARYTIPNSYGIRHAIGNVAEYVLEQGIVKGGSFKDAQEDCQISNTAIVDSPQHWVGFRNVCRWEKLEVGD